MKCLPHGQDIVATESDTTSSRPVEKSLEKAYSSIEKEKDKRKSTKKRKAASNEEDAVKHTAKPKKKKKKTKHATEQKQGIAGSKDEESAQNLESKRHEVQAKTSKVNDFEINLCLKLLMQKAQSTTDPATLIQLNENINNLKKLRKPSSSDGANIAEDIGASIQCSSSTANKSTLLLKIKDDACLVGSPLQSPTGSTLCQKN